MKSILHKATLALILIFALYITNAQDISYTLTAVRIRKEPSTNSEILDKLWAGTQVEILSEVKKWYKIRYQDQEGYILSSYIGKEFVPVPDITSIFNESSDSWLLGINPDKSLLFIINDNGWGGAVDGPSMSLDVFNYKTLESVQFIPLEGPEYGGDDHPDFSTPQIWQQTVIRYAWNNSGKELQELFSTYGLKTKLASGELPFKEIPIEQSNVRTEYITFGYYGEQYTSIKCIYYNNKKLWELSIFESEFDGEQIITEVVSLASIVIVNNEYMRINISSDNLVGCCLESETLHIYPIL